MLVKELVVLLQRFDQEAKVIGTWEGTIKELDVVTTDGRIMVDADNNDYKEVS